MNRWKGILGIDRAVAYTFLARAVSIVGSTGTVLLIVHFLSSIEQGYYYTLLSLVALQLVFELGFSFVVQQLAAHECVHLKIGADGNVSGDQVAHARLASTLQLSVRWYTVAAFVMGLVLAPLGMLFFGRHAAAGAVQVAWKGPWLVAVVASMMGLWCMPFYSFLEGCGQVRAVAGLRLQQAAVSAVLAWTAMLSHHGLYSPALTILGQVGIGLLFLGGRRRLLIGLLLYSTRVTSICWNREVLPFQWRIAVSWMCSYFTAQVFIPILFTLRGPIEAGQMGMSLSITGYMTALVLPWISTKATPFGQMIERKEFHKMDLLFLRTLGQSTGAFVLIAIAAVIAMLALPMIAPRLLLRMVPLGVFVILICAAGANCISQNLATLLRSFKREPFLAQSLVVSSLTIVLAVLTASHWGSAGAAFSYLIATGGIGLPSALFIFVCARRKYMSMDVFTACAERVQ